jgi:hypothetical protein
MEGKAVLACVGTDAAVRRERFDCKWHTFV